MDTSDPFIRSILQLRYVNAKSLLQNKPNRSRCNYYTFAYAGFKGENEKINSVDYFFNSYNTT